MHMDGQQRLLLEQAWETLSSSPNTDSRAALSTAVIVGIGTVEYNIIADHLCNGIYVATGKGSTCFAFNVYLHYSARPSDSYQSFKRSHN